jgi:hypothetical protein
VGDVAHHRGDLRGNAQSLARRLAEEASEKLGEKAVRIAEQAAERFQASARSREAYERTLAAVRGCTYLGGVGYPLEPRTRCDLIFTDDGMNVVAPFAGVIVEEPYPSIVALEITGNVTTTGGGFIGGGFGLGAVEGMAIATVLNSLTTKTNVNTVIQVQTASGELFLHTSSAAAEPLRVSLSPAFTRLRLAHAKQPKPVGSDTGSTSSDVIEPRGRWPQFPGCPVPVLG